MDECTYKHTYANEHVLTIRSNTHMHALMLMRARMHGSANPRAHMNSGGAVDSAFGVEVARALVLAVAVVAAAAVVVATSSSAVAAVQLT